MRFMSFLLLGAPLFGWDHLTWLDQLENRIDEAAIVWLRKKLQRKKGKFSEVMICDADGNYSIAKLILDSFSQLLYTTKSQEYAQIKALQNKWMTVVEVISHRISGKGG